MNQKIKKANTLEFFLIFGQLPYPEAIKMNSTVPHIVQIKNRGTKKNNCK